MGRVRAVEGTRVTPLDADWQVAPAAPGGIEGPAGLAGAALEWTAATVPSTAASALRAAGRWSTDDRRDFDASDWWYRREIQPEAVAPSTRRLLRLGGLATLAEVWLNGESLLSSRNMFLEHEVPIGGLLREREGNELVLCFRSIAAALKARRPRPRWRTRLVEAQQLRWIRTSLLGRIPTWTPVAAPVGPWRGVWLEDRSLLSVLRADVRPRIEGESGVVEVELTLEGTAAPPDAASIRIGEHRPVPLACERAPTADGPGRVIARGAARVDRVSRWWPHTHGPAERYPLAVEVSAGGRTIRVDLGKIGFREVEVDRSGDGFAVRLNGAPVFCRGACWTPVDAVSMSGPSESYRATLETVRAAGMNMVRVSGPFPYEDDAFYETCDELGIMVWQDYAFANMDYPGEDPEFVAEVVREARGLLDRTQTCAGLVVLCGNSEVEQQAAMMGAARDIWRSPLFGQTLPAVSAELRPDVAYWPSTPSGPGWPFVNDVGTANYFGVGAYLRPLEDARRAGVRFATECLAFANVPSEAVVEEVMQGGGTPPQDPRWKARTPRDGASGWDFEDVRDHYARELFGVDPASLRYAEGGRYLELSRVVPGEVMAATFAEWRRVGSRCGGALVWFLRDLCPGAGWGILDAHGKPKAPYYALRRALQPVAVLLLDEGLNGLDAHVVNEAAEPFVGELRVTAYRGETAVASASVAVRVQARGGERFRVGAMFDHFLDATYAYRFGAPANDCTVATLVDASTGQVRSEAFHFPGRYPFHPGADAGLEVVATPLSEGLWRATLRARRLAFGVELAVRDFEPQDNYFHVAPGCTHEVLLRSSRPGAKPQGYARPLNAHTATKIEVKA